MGELHLEWKDHDKALSTKLWEFLKEEYLVDFHVTCHGQQMKVHKFILALLFPMLKESLRSSGTFHFEQVLTEDGSPEEGSTIPKAHCLNLDNIADHAEDMNYLIQFAYTGKATVPKEHADCLMHIADSMEIKSLKDSLGKWNCKSRVTEKTEKINAIPLTRLRPRTELKVLDESLDMNSSDDDLDIQSGGEEQYSSSGSVDSIECFDDFSDDNSEELAELQQKHQGEQDCSEEKSIHKQNSTTTPENLTKKYSDKEANGGPSSQERTTPGEKIKRRKNLNCHLCNYVATYTKRLEQHLKSHDKKHPKGPKKFICKTCGLELGTKSLLDKHRASKCGTEIYECKYCDHKTRQKYSLQEHVMAKHQLDAKGNPLEKNLKCPECDYTCYAKHQLGYHWRAKHKRVGMFKCKECDYTAPYMNQIRKHDRVMHKNMRDYMCEECGKRFTTSGRLNNHVSVIHKGIKLHKCNICDAEYSDKLSFKIHLQRHEGKVEYKFVCHICGHNLRRKFELRTHMRNKHGIELEEASITDSDRCQLQNVVS